MIYRVTISQTYSGVHFDFDDIDEANKFALMVLSRGRYDNKEGYTFSATIRVMEEDEDNE